jgi:hypothetical protein
VEYKLNEMKANRVMVLLSSLTAFLMPKPTLGLLEVYQMSLFSSLSNPIPPQSDDPIIANLPKELANFVPPKYSVLAAVAGDLNQDKRIDYLLVLKQDGEDTLSINNESPTRRPLLIILANENRGYQLARRNDNVVYCYECGGVMGDPFTGIVIKDGFFSIEHYGGSAWRWTRIVTFKFSKKENDWFLHQDGSESFHVSEPNRIETRIKTIKDFGRIQFDDYNIYSED